MQKDQNMRLFFLFGILTGAIFTLITVFLFNAEENSDFWFMEKKSVFSTASGGTLEETVDRLSTITQKAELLREKHFSGKIMIIGPVMRGDGIREHSLDYEFVILYKSKKQAGEVEEILEEML